MENYRIKTVTQKNKRFVQTRSDNLMTIDNPFCLIDLLELYDTVY